MFSTEVLVCSGEDGWGGGRGVEGDRKRSVEAPLHVTTPSHPAGGVITQLQLFEYIDMPCNVADIR